jgi:Calx-beta domain-containing protein
VHTRYVRLVARLIAAMGLLLALPAPAMAATLTGPASISESAGTATYTLTCELADLGTVTVSPGPAPAATEGDDYTPPGLPTACALPGEQTIQVPIVNDTVDEADENLSVSYGPLTPQTVATTIVDDDPVASIAPVALVAEGDSGTSVAQLAVTLASAAVQPTTIGYATDDFSANSGTDYVATSGNLVIPTGQTTGTITVPIVGDTTPEKVEAFYVNLTTTDNGSLSPTKMQGAIGIFDNDKSPLPVVSLPKRVFAAEGDGNILFDVKLSKPAAQRTEVGWKTGNWTADKTDYDSSHGKLVFQEGQKSKTISIDVKGDRRDEPDEAFTVELRNPVAATLSAQKAAFGVIEDDDGPKMRIGKPRLRGERLLAKVGCPDSADGCRGKLVARSSGLRLGRKRFDLDSGETKTLKLKLSDAAQDALSERRRRAKLKATASDSTGDKRVTTRKARLRRLH